MQWSTNSSAFLFFSLATPAWNETKASQVCAIMFRWQKWRFQFHNVITLFWGIFGINLTVAPVTVGEEVRSKLLLFKKFKAAWMFRHRRFLYSSRWAHVQFLKKLFRFRMWDRAFLFLSGIVIVLWVWQRSTTPWSATYIFLEWHSINPSLQYCKLW